MKGAGKYDRACTRARRETQGQAVLLIVIQGQHGSGFSLQTLDETVVEGLPAILRNVADSIEKGQT